MSDGRDRTAAAFEAAAREWAKLFGLSAEEMRETAAALAPAFDLGIKRLMADPFGLSRMAAKPAAGVPAFPWLPTSGGPGSRDDLAASFFGSKGLAEAVARQASAASGVAPEAVRALMAPFAVLATQAMAQAAASEALKQAPAGLAAGDFGAATAEMLRRSANAIEALQRPSSAAAPAPFSPEAFQQMFANAMRAGKPAGAPPPDRADAPDMPPFPNPFSPFFTAAEPEAQPAEAEPDRAPEPAPSGETAAPGAPQDVAGALFADLLQSGERMREDYLGEMTRLFERFPQVKARPR
ncbi:hypothetical protein [Mangrovibrevibacter kandeliae]|uniref:hypothetical protein n=1 Tax=Mangrovibrevibacter kandeliae TaxID=2968473 RepID=UPI0021179491|nr:hypothetical protein [Aurantimonas sp. CSK15Z-1]MCQ8780791.1 hypothetical protein [Aurantimonas sp. CSK15Z-1]